MYRHEVPEVSLYISRCLHDVEFKIVGDMAYITVFMTVSNYQYTFTLIVLCIITFLKFLKLEKMVDLVNTS